MKKLLVIAAIAGVITACNDSSTDNTTVTDSTTITPMETTPAPSTTDSAAVSANTVKDSMMTLKDGKVMIMAGGSWAALDKSVTCTNGRKVSPNGEVSKGDKKRMLTEGQMIDKDGQMMDKDGKMMDNTGWE